MLGPVLIVGDRRPYVTALVTLDPEEARAAIANEHATLAELAADERVQKTVTAAFERANRSLARYEQVRRFRILDKELTIANGEITPTMKLRRKVVGERYQDIIEALYATSGPAPHTIEVRA